MADDISMLLAFCFIFMHEQHSPGQIYFCYILIAISVTSLF